MSDNSKTNDAPKSGSEELKPSEQEKVSGGASDVFTSFGDIKGETTGSGHEGWIEILSYNK